MTLTKKIVISICIAIFFGFGFYALGQFGEAILRKGSNKLHLIYANGRHTEGLAHVTEHNSFNLNPGNDHRFTENLSAWIDKRVPPQK